MDRASELGVACQVPNMPANSRSTPRQLPAPAGFTGGWPPNLPGRVSPAAAASLRSGYMLAPPRRGHLRDSRPDKIDRRAMAAFFLGSLL